MKHLHGSLIGLAAVWLLAAGCGLIKSESRDVEVQQQNLSAKLHKGEWAGVTGFFAPDATYINGPGAKPITQGAAAAFIKSIQDIAARGNLITEVKRVTEIRPGVMIAAVNYNISIADPTRQSTIDWDAAVTWTKINGEWKITEMKEITGRERTSGY